MSSTETDGRELFVRHARKGGRSVVVLRAMQRSDACIVETEVYPAGGNGAAATAVRPGPYTFADAAQATQFVTEAVEALMLLGCDVHAQ